MIFYFALDDVDLFKLNQDKENQVGTQLVIILPELPSFPAIAKGGKYWCKCTFSYSNGDFNCFCFVEKMLIPICYKIILVLKYILICWCESFLWEQ